MLLTLGRTFQGFSVLPKQARGLRLCILMSCHRQQKCCCHHLSCLLCDLFSRWQWHGILCRSLQLSAFWECYSLTWDGSTGAVWSSFRNWRSRQAPSLLCSLIRIARWLVILFLQIQQAFSCTGWPRRVPPKMASGGCGISNVPVCQTGTEQLWSFFFWCSGPVHWLFTRLNWMAFCFV